MRPRSAYFDQALKPDGTPRGPAVFVPPRLAEDIRAEHRIVVGPGRSLWRDAGGVFRPDGRQVVEDAVRQILDDEFKASRLSEVLSYLGTFLLEISTAPPPENLVNVANGVLDLDTLELRPVGDGDRFTYRLPVAWNPEARCPAIAEFIADVLPEDVVGSRLVGELLGMCILPTARFRRAVMLLGAGSNGKSVFLQLVRELLGVENVAAVTLQALAEDRFAMAELFGKLANVAGDLDSRPLERSGAFKTLTGGDLVTADRKYGQPFTFVSFATLVFSANEWPVSHDQSDAYFTRWLAVPFTRRYREDGAPLQAGERRADPRLVERLTTAAELEGLLVAAVRGARRLRARGGFEVPASVRDAVTEYRSWADTVVAWVDECVTPTTGRVLTRKAVYDAYRAWCRENGREPLGAKRFWPRFRSLLQERGVEVAEGKSSGTRTVEGLAVEGAAVAWGS